VYLEDGEIVSVNGATPESLKPKPLAPARKKPTKKVKEETF